MSPAKGQKHTEETKIKMRKSHTRSWLGKKHTEETKEKMRQSVHKADLVGKRFGRLTVISLVRVSRRRQTIWLCKCDCGNEVTLSIVKLRDGGTRSCGCLRAELTRKLGKKNTLGYGVAAGNSVLYGYKKSAKLRSLSWKLTDDEFFDLVKKDCYYCGSEPNLVSKRSKTFNGSFIHNGIDRINNDLGYTKENCITCCKNCNYAKRSLSYDDFLDLIKKIYGNLNMRSIS